MFNYAELITPKAEAAPRRSSRAGAREAPSAPDDSAASSSPTISAVSSDLDLNLSSVLPTVSASAQAVAVEEDLRLAAVLDRGHRAVAGLEDEALVGDDRRLPSPRGFAPVLGQARAARRALSYGSCPVDRARRRGRASATGRRSPPRRCSAAISLGLELHAAQRRVRSAATVGRLPWRISVSMRRRVEVSTSSSRPGRRAARGISGSWPGRARRWR